MRSICLWLFVVAVNVSALQHRFNDPNNPIKLVGTNTNGQGGVERIVNLYAEIRPHHLTTGVRNDFPQWGAIERHFQAIRAPGNERGHLGAGKHIQPFTTKFNGKS